MSVGGERVLTQRELNRALLERQLLSDRKRHSLQRTLERIGGIQAQYAPSMYIGLWSRLRDFHRDELTHALYRRSVVQATLMRVTIHLVSVGDFWPFAVGLRKPRREAWLRAHRGKPTAAEVEAAARRARPRFKGAALSRKDLIEGMDSATFNGLGLWLDLVRVPPAGTWERRRADLYATARDWLGPHDVSAAQGLELLVRRYLQGFGPAAAAEVADWAGIPVRLVAGALDRLELRHFRDQKGRLLVDLPRAPLPDADTTAPVRYLPTWDATLLAHARASQILPEEHRPKVFHTRNPQSIPTFLVDGEVAGTWKHEKDRIRLEPFRPLASEARSDLEDEGERLAAFHAGG